MTERPIFIFLYHCIIFYILRINYASFFFPRIVFLGRVFLVHSYNSLGLKLCPEYGSALSPSNSVFQRGHFQEYLAII